MASKQAGNAILIILIAVFLFGALAAAFMRGAKTGQSNLSVQQAKLYAQEIINTGKDYESATTKMRNKGCSENQFDFANGVFTQHGGTIIYATNHNTRAPSDGSCSYFNTNGGRLTAALISDSYTYFWTGTVPSSSKRGILRLAISRLPGIGVATNQDLLIFIPYIKKEICLEINNILGVTNPSGEPPTAPYSTLSYTTGTYDATSQALTDQDGVLAGKSAYCVKDTVPNYSYFQLLIER